MKDLDGHLRVLMGYKCTKQGHRFTCHGVLDKAPMKFRCTHGDAHNPRAYLRARTLVLSTGCLFFLLALW